MTEKGKDCGQSAMTEMKTNAASLMTVFVRKVFKLFTHYALRITIICLA